MTTGLIADGSRFASPMATITARMQRIAKPPRTTSNCPVGIAIVALFTNASLTTNRPPPAIIAMIPRRVSPGARRGVGGRVING